MWKKKSKWLYHYQTQLTTWSGENPLTKISGASSGVLSWPYQLLASVLGTLSGTSYAYFDLLRLNTGCWLVMHCLDDGVITVSLKWVMKTLVLQSKGLLGTAGDKSGICVVHVDSKTLTEVKESKGFFLLLLLLFFFKVTVNKLKLVLGNSYFWVQELRKMIPVQRWPFYK